MLFWSLFFTTFIVEDWAIAASLVLVAQNKISVQTAFLACFLGISVGDILLYGLGRATVYFRKLNEWSYILRARSFLKKPKTQKNLTWIVVVSRAIPGTRFFAYVGAGVAEYPVWKFLVITPLSVGAWVFIAFTGGQFLLQHYSQHWFLGILLFLVTLSVVRNMWLVISNKWRRKAAKHFWRRWLIFEYWPAWFAYAPIVPYYIYLSIKFRSAIQPFYANPSILNAGIIGESKWDIQEFLDPKDPATLPTLLLPKYIDTSTAKDLIAKANISYPFIMKPKVGQRGFAVRFINNNEEFANYFELADFEILVQRKSQYRREAGFFYIRRPGEASGEIYSITDKEFPYVIGDGKTQLGDLILNHPRLRIMTVQHFTRHADDLENVIPDGVVYYLTACGNHCQGALFIDGNFLKTEALRARIEQITYQIPHFYFGRVDVRYQDHSSLMRGENFEIIEINGAGADITHIYDPRTRLVEAYRVMFTQWRLLFETGHASRELHAQTAQVCLGAFLKECARVQFKKKDLAVSS